MKYLIGWVASNNDFDRNDSSKPVNTGPNYSFHEYFFDKEKYDKHILLFNETNDAEKNRVNKLVGFISHHLGKKNVIEAKALKIEDVIDLNEIKNKVRKVIESLGDVEEVHFYISPGTSAMQIAWHYLHLELSNIKTRLVQTRSGQFTNDGNPELIFIEVEKSSTPTTLIRKEASDKKRILRVDDGILITKSLEKIYQNAHKVAIADNINVLIHGQTGAGKEHLAFQIHNLSTRNTNQFVTVNCSSFSDDLLLSELFGHVKGSFSHAIKDRKGLFETANYGTIFLDEIGDISPLTQQSLLRVIQNGEIRPVGSDETKKVDVRIVSATHKDLKKLCADDKFRWDLYYRISGATLQLPSLLERGEDEISEYLDFILRQVSVELNRPILKLSVEVRKHLLSYHYPGNLREMHNIISNMYVFHEDGIYNSFEYLPDIDFENYTPGNKLSESVAPYERRHISKILRFTNGNISKAAIVLGVSQNTLRSKCKNLKIEITNFVRNS